MKALIERDEGFSTLGARGSGAVGPLKPRRRKRDRDGEGRAEIDQVQLPIGHPITHCKKCVRFSTELYQCSESALAAALAEMCVQRALSSLMLHLGTAPAHPTAHLCGAARTPCLIFRQHLVAEIDHVSTRRMPVAAFTTRSQLGNRCHIVYEQQDFGSSIVR